MPLSDTTIRNLKPKDKAYKVSDEKGLYIQVTPTVEEDYEALDETEEEWSDDDDVEALSEEDQHALETEINELREFAALATSIEQNAKGRALLTALEVGFAKAREFGAAEKAIIFTESRRTQSYLLRVLADSPWADSIVLFNGSNTDEQSRTIYQEWIARHAGSDRVTGSRTADMRSALVDYFRDTGKIMIATEAGAEGINLQFCSMIVNYDLPWNPQRIEQRIGRCHRYGQKHDVVVVNFLNRENEADQRVYQLLSEKFQLFEGVFGASDEVLGAVESGVDFEKRIRAQPGCLLAARPFIGSRLPLCDHPNLGTGGTGGIERGCWRRAFAADLVRRISGQYRSLAEPHRSQDSQSHSQPVRMGA